MGELGLENFDLDNIKDKLQIYDSLVEELNCLKILLKQKILLKNDFDGKRTALGLKIKSLENKIPKGFLVNCSRILHLGKSYRYYKNIEDKKSELENIEKEIARLKEEQEEIEIKMKVIDQQIKKFEIPSYLKMINGRILITDSKELYVNEERSDEKVLVHSTDFWPENHRILSAFDGNKRGNCQITYQGETKDVQCLMHRHETHFTINSRVGNTSDGLGNWTSKPFMIVEPLKFHKDEMESFSPNDAWTKGKSLTLSDQAVILVDINQIDKVPKQKLLEQEYKIVYFSGDPVKCLRNFLKYNNYQVLSNEPNDPSHAHSTRIVQEDGLNARDLAINFMYDNSYDGKSKIDLSTSEVIKMIDIAMNSEIRRIVPYGFLGNSQLRKLCSEISIPKEEEELFLKMVGFIIASGLIENDDKYTFLNDESVFERVEKIHNDLESMEYIPKELIARMYNLWKEYRKLAIIQKDASLATNFTNNEYNSQIEVISGRK